MLSALTRLLPRRDDHVCPAWADAAEHMHQVDGEHIARLALKVTTLEATVTSLREQLRVANQACADEQAVVRRQADVVDTLLAERVDRGWDPVGDYRAAAADDDHPDLADIVAAFYGPDAHPDDKHHPGGRR